MKGIKMSDWFEVKELETGLWALREPHHVEGVISYLIEGRERAVLIDTGMGIMNIRPVVEELTELPVLVVNTHSHYDHVGDNHDFNEITIHREESKELERGVGPGKLTDQVRPDTFLGPPPDGFNPQTYQIRPSHPTRILKASDQISLGNHTLEVIHTPGHSPGSICLWEKDRGLLFSGDTVYDGPLYVQLPDSDFDTYQQSLRLLGGLESQIQKVYPSHGDSPLEPTIISKIAQALDRIAQGGIEYWYDQSPWGQIRVYELEGIKVFLKNNVRGV
jgi:glyoxylase-like metal-dependent hydrolase (beta-lactamase superfamily II)